MIRFQFDFIIKIRLDTGFLLILSLVGALFRLINWTESCLLLATINRGRVFNLKVENSGFTRAQSFLYILLLRLILMPKRSPGKCLAVSLQILYYLNHHRWSRRSETNIKTHPEVVMRFQCQSVTYTNFVSNSSFRSI